MQNGIKLAKGVNRRQNYNSLAQLTVPLLTTTKMRSLFAVIFLFAAVNASKIGWGPIAAPVIRGPLLAPIVPVPGIKEGVSIEGPSGSVNTGPEGAVIRGPAPAVVAGPIAPIAPIAPVVAPIAPVVAPLALGHIGLGPIGPIGLGPIGPLGVDIIGAGHGGWKKW